MDTKKIALNAAMTGAVAMVATKLLLGDTLDVNYFGMPMDASIANGLACGAGSVVSDLTSDMVISKLSMSNQIINGSTIAVKAGVGGAASAAVLYFGGMPSDGIPGALLVGAGSKLGGDYAADKLFFANGGIINIF